MPIKDPVARAEYEISRSKLPHRKELAARIQKESKSAYRWRFEHNLKVKYGIDSEDMARMYEEQLGLCAICKDALDLAWAGKSKNTCVDHCHLTGKVRSLLCRNCNSAVGMVKEDIEILEKMIEYLRAHNGY